MALAWPTAHRRPIGLDIGDRWIKAVQLDADGTRIAAAASIQRRVQPTGEADAFTVDDARRLAGVLRRRGFIGRRVVVAAPPRAVMTSLLELPPRGCGAPLAQIARSELAHAHRRESDAMEVAFWDIPQSTRPTEGTPVMAAACAHADAQALIDPLEHAGLRVEALDLHGWAVARMVQRRATPEPPTPADDATNAADTNDPTGMTAAVDIGWSSATLILLHGPSVVYERSLTAAGVRDLAAAVTRTHGFAPGVVEYLLRDLGFAAHAASPDDADLRLKAIGQFEAHFEGLAQELRLSMSYAQHQYPRTPVRHVVLTGGGAGVPGLGEHMDPLIDCTVAALSPADVLPCGDALRAEAGSPALTVAAGLALWDEKGAISCAA